MKNCPICHRNYSDQFQFCSRDGTKLQIKSSDPDVKHCALCGKYYPPSLDNCPVHGIAFGAVIEQSALDQPPYKTSEEKKFQSTNIWLLEQGIVEQEDDNPVPQNEDVSQFAPPPEQPESDSASRPAANTKELGLPPAITLNSLTQYPLEGYAAADRRLIAVMAVLVVFFIAVLGAYALSRPSKSENSGNTPLISSQSDQSDSFAEPSDTKSIEPVDEQTYAEEEAREDGEELVQKIDLEFVQQIPLPSSMSDAKPALSFPQPSKRTSPSSTSVRGGGKSPAQPRSSKSVAPSRQKPEQSNSKSASKDKAYKGSSGAKTADDPRKPVSPNRPSPAAENILDNDSRGSSQRGSSDLDYRNADPHASDEGFSSRPKSSNRRAAKIVARIANKSRTRISNGYLYQFDLILHEANGLNIRWRSVDVRKVAFSGKSSIIDGLTADDKVPDNEAQYRIVVKMTGICIEDWFGQLITKSMGIDEYGDPVELEQTLLLDDSFPLYSSNDSYRTRSYSTSR